MTDFETIVQHETEFGNRNFVFVARKLAKGEHGESEFISIVRGYVDPNGHRRFKMTLTLPPDPDVVGFVQDALGKV